MGRMKDALIDSCERCDCTHWLHRKMNEHERLYDMCWIICDHRYVTRIKTNRWDEKTYTYFRTLYEGLFIRREDLIMVEYYDKVLNTK